MPTGMNNLQFFNLAVLIHKDLHYDRTLISSLSGNPGIPGGRIFFISRGGFPYHIWIGFGICFHCSEYSRLAFLLIRNPDCVRNRFRFWTLFCSRNRNRFGICIRRVYSNITVQVLRIPSGEVSGANHVVVTIPGTEWMACDDGQYSYPVCAWSRDQLGGV